MSNYVVSFSSDKYGGKQDDFLLQSASVVEKAVARFRQVQGGEETTLFYETLDFFGKERQRIAKEHDTKKAHYFGVRRDGEAYEGPFMNTPLYDPYDEYNPKALKAMLTHLKTMDYSRREFKQTSLKIDGEECMGKKFSTEVAIYCHGFSDAWDVMSYKGYVRICKLCGVDPEPEREQGEGSLLDRLFEDKKVMETLRANSMEDYKRVKLISHIVKMRELKPEKRKSDWILVTLRMEIDSKMYALSQYLTWAYRDFQRDPLDRMKEESIVTILHQDPFLIEKMLADIAQIFKRAIEWKGKEITDLMPIVALLEYEFAHAMPHKRGSGAIAEWFERAIFDYHGYQLTYNPKKMVTFEAYVSTPKDFVDNYKEMITLTKKECSNPETDSSD